VRLGSRPPILVIAAALWLPGACASPRVVLPATLLLLPLSWWLRRKERTL